MSRLSFHLTCRQCRLTTGVRGNLLGRSEFCPYCDSRLDTQNVPVGALGRFRLDEYLAKGGWGEVYKGHEPAQADRPIAVKFCVDSQNMALARFGKEKLALAKLDHPNICEIYDYDEVGGVPFLVMRYLEGGTLQDRIDAARPTIDEAVEWTRSVANAVAYAHRHGVVHRDLKPGNLIFDETGRLVVTDFGLALMTDADGHTRISFGAGGGLTATPVGTPLYAPPEQLKGKPLAHGPACDVYSLGVVFYRLLTGEHPFRGPYPGDHLARTPQERIVEGLFHPPSFHDPGLGAELEAICMKAMATRAKHRFPTMQALADALADCRGYAAPRGTYHPVAGRPGAYFFGRLSAEMVRIEAGTFAMGEPEPGPGPTAGRRGRPTAHNRPVRNVRIERPFYFGAHPVTQAQYREIFGEVPLSPFSGHAERPADGITWFDAILFCNRLSAQDGLAPAYQIRLRPADVQVAEGGGYQLVKVADQRIARSAERPGSRGEAIHAEDDLLAFLECNRLSRLDGLKAAYVIPPFQVRWNRDADGYRLPTEAEWEYACRGGGTLKYGAGDDVAYLSAHAWFELNARGRTHRVGGRAPNGFGLLDTLGNVWEWCWDYYDFHAQSERKDGAPDGGGPPSGEERVLRGGSWNSPDHSVGCAIKLQNKPDLAWNEIGFRLARTATSPRA